MIIYNAGWGGAEHREIRWKHYIRRRLLSYIQLCDPKLWEHIKKIWF